jgi:hypothetical protein
VARRPLLPALLAVAALTLAGCGGGSGSGSEPSTGGAGTTSSGGSSDTGTTASTSTGSVDGVRLTPQGTRLKVGDTARVSWQPDQKTTGVIGVTVTGLLKVPNSTFSAWRLSADTRTSTPYFVHATVRNLGRSDLSHAPVPLYVLDQRGALLQASRFRATFTPCPSRPLPDHFGRGDKASVCLVYFAPDHGTLVGVSFRPTEDFDQILWTGEVVSNGGRQHNKKH